MISGIGRVLRTIIRKMHIHIERKSMNEFQIRLYRTNNIIFLKERNFWEMIRRVAGIFKLEEILGFRWFRFSKDGYHLIYSLDFLLIQEYILPHKNWSKESGLFG